MATAVQAQDNDERVTDRDPDARDVAMTPLRDLNVARDGIPEVLLEATASPYASDELPNCSAIIREVNRLNAVLGPDFDQEAEERRDITAAKVARAGVASFIPFRGLIREVSGAADAERDLRAAIIAGAARRGFLKGLGAQRGCAYPARPAVARPASSSTDGETVVTNPDGSTTTFRRREMVQGN